MNKVMLYLIVAVLCGFTVPKSAKAAPVFCGDFGTVFSDVDFNGNCIVDFEDFVIYARLWLGFYQEPALDGIFNGINIERLQSHISEFELPVLPNQKYNPIVEIEPGGNIQPAIDQLAANGGGVVKLLSGNHYIEDTIYLKSNITLMGEGVQSVLIRAQESELKYMIYTPGGIADTVICDLMIDGAVDTEYRNWIWEVNNQDAKPMGLFILDDNGQRNNRIAVCRVHITRTAMGFHSKGTDDLILSGVEFYDNGGVDLYFHNAYLRRNERVLVRNSKFADSHTGNGLNLTLQRNIIVKDNIFSNNNFRGVRAANTENIVWEGNISFGNGDFGIGTRSELSVGVNWYVLADNYSWNNAVNYSMLSASNGLQENNTEQAPLGW